MSQEVVKGAHSHNKESIVNSGAVFTQATDKLTPLVTSALAAVDNSDYQLDGNALKKAAQALSAALQDLMGVLGETKRTLWSLDVNNAQEILNEAIERLDKVGVAHRVAGGGGGARLRMGGLRSDAFGLEMIFVNRLSH